ncbi:S8 family peptidase [Telluribacter sp.]|jgi:subtilisin family serine protease|uniref:S8 family peptidase n=1 Tax=Telluribacter sp. TaxID=1978767 RepID=UPI002E143201|nr:S8 family peptidase [Telluribacter sp.]
MKLYFTGLLLVLGTFLSDNILAQNAPRYLVLFKDKTGSPFSIQNPEAYLSGRAIARRQRQNIAITTQDLPVNPAYVTALRQSGARVFYTSRWFNGAVVEATDTQLAAIRNLPFFRGLERNLPLANINSTTTPGIARLAETEQKLGTTEIIDYGRMTDQLALLGVPALHEKGLLGQGVLIAVFDSGFSRANQLTYLKPLFDTKRVLDTQDFVARDGDVYQDDNHGLNVLSTIAAYQPGALVGAAFGASFALYRTENDLSESPYEEVTWLLAAERADSLGADIINSSLGYSTFLREFNTPAYNYTYASMNGNTTIVSRAARFAARKGILVVNAAGNDGDDSWRYISAPADVDSVLVVGATYLNRAYAPFSSVGPTANGIMKPDVAALGVGAVIGTDAGQGGGASGNGTSFATPQIAGLAALLLQEFPFLSAQQLSEVLKRSGHQASRPDNFLGFGVPSAQRAEDIVMQEFAPLGTEPGALSTVTLFPNPVTEEIYLNSDVLPAAPSGTYQVLNVAGTILLEIKETTRPVASIPVKQLPSGLYFLRITTPGQVRTFKFVKQ